MAIDPLSAIELTAQQMRERHVRITKPQLVLAKWKRDHYIKLFSLEEVLQLEANFDVQWVDDWQEVDHDQVPK